MKRLWIVGLLLAAGAAWGLPENEAGADRAIARQKARLAALIADARVAAKVAGVKGDVVLTDLAEARYRELVRESFMNGVRSGVNGTPTLFIDGIRYDGPRDEETLVAVLRRVADQAGVGGRA